MNDGEFIELLNLYVDGEIRPADALRLEAEVATDAGRRKVYDQYCRMHKACSMLSAELAEAAAERPEGFAAEFPAARAWRFRPVLAGLAAAACIAAVFGLRHGGRPATGDVSAVAANLDASRTIPDTVDLSIAPDAMRPVFLARIPGGQAARPETKAVFAMADESPSLAQLNWIGDIHMAPVFSAAKPDFLLSPKPDLKSGISDEVAGGRFPQEPTEMTAFRFQR
jgi:anti-sigma factor RsiW